MAKTLPKPLPKTPPKSQCNDVFFVFLLKSAPRASQERPRALQERLKSVQERPRAPQERPKSVPRAPQARPRAAKSAQERPKSGQRCLQNRPGEPSATILRVGNAENTLVESDRSLESLEKRIPDDCQMIFRQCAQMWDYEKHAKTVYFARFFASRLFCARVISRNKRISEKHENRSLRGPKIKPPKSSQDPPKSSQDGPKLFVGDFSTPF